MTFFQFSGVVKSITMKSDYHSVVTFSSSQKNRDKIAIEVDAVNGERLSSGRYQEIPQYFEISNLEIIKMLNSHIDSEWLIEYEDFNGAKNLKKITLCK